MHPRKSLWMTARWPDSRVVSAIVLSIWGCMTCLVNGLVFDSISIVLAKINPRNVSIARQVSVCLCMLHDRRYSGPLTWTKRYWSHSVCNCIRISSSHPSCMRYLIFDSIAIRASLIRPPNQTIFQRSTETYIDLSTPSSSYRLVHVPWRKRHCYEKEMVLLWRYCSLGYVGSRHDCRNKSYLIRDRTGLPPSLPLPFLLTKWSDIIFSSLLSFTRERTVYSMSLNLATRREVSIAVGTVGVVFSATDSMPRCLDCLEASSWVLDAWSTTSLIQNGSPDLSSWRLTDAFLSSPTIPPPMIRTKGSDSRDSCYILL